MSKRSRKKTEFSALRYTDGPRTNRTAKAQYLQWRAEQNPPHPIRCDNQNCRFHTEPLIWNGAPLSLILDHRNGVNSDNRHKNLRLLCPNCDSQNTNTRGGANAGRVIKSSGGFALVGRDGRNHYVLPIETGHYELSLQPV